MHRWAEDLLVVIATLSIPAAAEAGTCRWAEPNGWTSLRQHERIVELHRDLVCSHDAAGTLEATISTTGPGARVLKTVRLKVEPQGRWQRNLALREKLFPYGTDGYCDEKASVNPAKLALRLDDGELKPSVAVRLRLAITGSGDLAPLRLSEELEAVCLACPRASGSLNLYDQRSMSGAIKAGVKLRGEVERAAWDCLSTDATLEIRYFVGESHRDAEKRIRPDVVQARVEKAFKVGRDKATLELAPPLAELCRVGGTKVVLEVGGRGQLRRIGSRLHLDLKCK